MKTIIFDTITGDILAVVNPGQNLLAVRSNWADKSTGLIEIPDDFKLLNSIRRVQYRIDTNTKQLIPS